MKLMSLHSHGETRVYRCFRPLCMHAILLFPSDFIAFAQERCAVHIPDRGSARDDTEITLKTDVIDRNAGSNRHSSANSSACVPKAALAPSQPRKFSV
jgi:hypothetical protein